MTLDDKHLALRAAFIPNVVIRRKYGDFMQPTTLSTWALLVWQELKERGIDAQGVFERAGLEVKKLSEPTSRYPMRKMHRLWQEVLNETEDPLVGISIGRKWNPTTFHAFGFAWLASASLHDAIHRMERYCKIFNDAMEVDLAPAGANYLFRASSKANPEILHACAIDASLVALLKMFRAICGKHFHPLEVSLRAPKTPASGALEDYFQCPIHFARDDSYWLISQIDLDRTLITGNEELAHVNDNIALEYLSSLNKAQIIPAVQHAITSELPSGKVSEKHIASKLNMSPRTMQRKLEAENQTFSKLLQSQRKSLARRYLLDRRMSLTEISYVLGFSEQASFTRAFKRWYGVPPSAYKEQDREIA